MNCPKCDADISESYEPDDWSVGIVGGYYCDACDLAVGEDEYEPHESDVGIGQPQSQGAGAVTMEELARVIRINTGRWVIAHEICADVSRAILKKLSVRHLLAAAPSAQSQCAGDACQTCNGTGQTGAAYSLEYKGIKEDRERMQAAADTRVACWRCNGTGKLAAAPSAPQPVSMDAFNEGIEAAFREIHALCQDATGDGRDSLGRLRKILKIVREVDLRGQK